MIEITKDTPFGQPLDPKHRIETTWLSEDTEEHFEYDENDCLVHYWDDEGGEEWLFHFPNGRTEWEISRYRDSPVDRTRYDREGRMVCRVTHRRDHPCDPSHFIKREEYWVYDTSGKMASQTKRVNDNLTYEFYSGFPTRWHFYDEQGRRIETRTEDGGLVVFEHVGDVETATFTHPDKKEHSRCWTKLDDEGRPLERLYNTGARVWWDYDTGFTCGSGFRYVVKRDRRNPILDGFVAEE